MPFLPAGAQASDLIMVEGVIYAATENGCGGAPNGVWAIKPAATPAGGKFPDVRSWKTGGTASAHAPAFSEEGAMFVTVGSGTGAFADSVVSLDRATFAVKGQFKQAGADFVSSPVVFRAENRDIVAVQRNDGQVLLLDGAAPGGAPLASSAALGNSPRFRPRGLAVWQDAAEQWWIAATTSTSVISWKVEVKGSSVSLNEGWKFGNLQAPLAPLVVNNLVFVLSSGDSGAKRGSAVLYALDATSGKVLWNSGKSLTTYVPQSSAIWNSMGQVLVGAADSTLYAFGMTMERHL